MLIYGEMGKTGEKSEISHHWREQTLEKYPEAWYMNSLPVFIGGEVVAVLVLLFQWRFGLFFNPGFTILGLLAYVLGEVFDIDTTRRVFELKPSFDKLGLEFPVQEKNPLLPNHPTLRQLVFSLDTLVKILFLGVGVIVPAGGFMALFMRLIAGLSNLRERKRLLMILELVGKDEWGRSTLRPHH